MSKNRMAASREHILPRSKGGGAGNNIVLSHKKCNVNRGNRLPNEEMIMRGKLIWAKATRFPQIEIEKFSRDKTVYGTYCSAYSWPHVSLGKENGEN